MLRWLYIQLLWAHPAQFRYRFCDEMLEVFDHSRGLNERLRLLLDGLVSLWRQWVLRPEYRQPWQSVAASGPIYDVLTFQQIEPYKPRGIALAQGGLVALLLLLGMVNAINHGGGKVRTFLIGMHRPGHGLIRVDRASFEAGKLNTTVDNGRDSDDPWRPFARSYFRIIRVLSALDADGNLIISSPEMINAPAALRRLDLNHDGKLSAEECGFLPPGDFDGTVDRVARYRRDFMRDNPVLAALDSDHDGEISAAEIANSPAALQSLDFNQDGSLTPYELIPSQALSRAAAMMTRFDTNDAGVISVQGVSNEDADAASIRRILTAADRNHDGVVTRGELIVELAGRTVTQPKQVPASRTLK
jgi:Ca2+-binding EF-hand superfamily protein